MTHYHIHWSGRDTLDWERFSSRGEAEASAKQLVRSGETYTIEERDDACPRCHAAFALKKTHPPASTESRPEPEKEFRSKARPA